MILKIADGAQTGVEQYFLGDFADAMEGAHREGTEECDLGGFGDDGETGGFLEIAGEFGEEFVGGDSDTGREAAFGSDSVLEGLGEGVGAEEGVVMCAGAFAAEVGHIEVGFVHGDLLDQGTGPGEEGHDQPGFGAILVHSGREKDGGGAETGGGAGRHGRTDAEPAGLVAGSTDNTPAVGG